jgi:hypothetical protein
MRKKISLQPHLSRLVVIKRKERKEGKREKQKEKIKVRKIKVKNTKKDIKLIQLP